MHTVSDSLRLLFYLIFGLVFLFGQGWFFIGILLYEDLKKENLLSLKIFPLLLLGGLILNYTIILIIQSLAFSYLIGLILSLVGISHFIYFLKKDHRDYLWRREEIYSYTIVFIIGLLYLAPILAEPLISWDGRSIWFFHARMIYLANTIGQQAGWQHASVAFSHVDYPKLLPALAAQIIYMLGFWNEYFPKLALFYILLPAIMWVSSLFKVSFSFLFLLILFPFSYHEWLWNGYLDAQLALYFALSILLFGEYLESFQPLKLISSLVCLIFTLHLKNEGILAVLTGALGIAVSLFWLHKSKSIVKSCNLCKIPWRYWFVLFVALISFIIWLYYKQLWHLSSDLGIGTLDSLLRIIERLVDGTYLLILKYLVLQVCIPFLFFILISVSSFILTRKVAKQTPMILIVSTVYALGIFLVYLLTPYEIHLHLESSIGRVCMAINSSIYVGCYFGLLIIEQPKSLLID